VAPDKKLAAANSEPWCGVEFIDLNKGGETQDELAMNGLF